MSNLSRPEFNDEIKAREWLEAELWPNGPICPHCGTIDEATLMHGKSHRSTLRSVTNSQGMERLIIQPRNMYAPTSDTKTR